MSRLTPQQLAALAETVAAVYRDGHTAMLLAIARRAATGGSSPTWYTDKATELLALQRDIETIIARLDTLTPALVLDALATGYRTGHTSALPVTDSTTPVPVTIARRAVLGYATQTTQALAAAARSTGANALASYRAVISTAVAPVILGISPQRTAVADALDRMAATGLAGFTDKAGRVWEPESYARMAVYTAAANAYDTGTVDRLTAAGYTYAIVSDVAGECVRCRPFEGQLLALDAAGLTAATVGGFRVTGTLATAKAAGFKHPGCRHTLSAYVPGMSAPRTGLADPAGAKARERQRALERRVRDWQRRAAVARTTAEKARVAGDLETRAAAEQHTARANGFLRTARADLKTHWNTSEAAGIYLRGARDPRRAGEVTAAAAKRRAADHTARGTG